MVIEQQTQKITAYLRKTLVITNMLETFLCVSSDSILLQGVYLYTHIVLVELGCTYLSADAYYLK